MIGVHYCMTCLFALSNIGNSSVSRISIWYRFCYICHKYFNQREWDGWAHKPGLTHLKPPCLQSSWALCSVCMSCFYSISTGWFIIDCLGFLYLCVFMICYMNIMLALWFSLYYSYNYLWLCYVIIHTLNRIYPGGVPNHSKLTKYHDTYSR